MKKLHSFAFYALVTPVITLAASTALAQQPAGQAADREQQTTQRGQDVTPSTTRSTQADQTTTRSTQADQATQRGSQTNPTITQGSRPVGQATPTQAGQSTQSAGQATPATSQGAQSSQRGSQTAAQVANRETETERMEHRGYMNTAPARGMEVSDLIGAEVSTVGDEDIGSVEELVIDENGQIVAIVVGVGGFLGMAEKDVAIGWGHVTRSGNADDHELRIDVTGEELRAAPEFKRDE